MHFARARSWDWLTALAGLLLLVALWAPWYTQYGTGVSAWEQLAGTDLWLALFGALAVALPLVTAGRDSTAVPLVVNVALLTVGVVAILLVILAAVRLPSFIGMTVSFDPDGPVPDGTIGRGWGMWLALLATPATFLAAGRALRDDRAPDLRPAPEPTRMPVPPVTG